MMADPSCSGDLVPWKASLEIASPTPKQEIEEKSLTFSKTGTAWLTVTMSMQVLCAQKVTLTSAIQGPKRPQLPSWASPQVDGCPVWWFGEHPMWLLISPFLNYWLYLEGRERRRGRRGVGEKEYGQGKRGGRWRDWQVEKLLSGCTTHTRYPVFDALFAFLSIRNPSVTSAAEMPLMGQDDMWMTLNSVSIFCPTI